SIAAGATSVTFAVATTPVNANANAAITAKLGTATKSANLAVKATVVAALALNPTTVAGGTGSTGTVTLSGPAQSGGATVALSSNNAAATVPASVVVPAGAITATFAITTKAVSGSTNVNLTASLNG